MNFLRPKEIPIIPFHAAKTLSFIANTRLLPRRPASISLAGSNCRFARKGSTPAPRPGPYCNTCKWRAGQRNGCRPPRQESGIGDKAQRFRGVEWDNRDLLRPEEIH